MLSGRNCTVYSAITSKFNTKKISKTIARTNTIFGDKLVGALIDEGVPIPGSDQGQKSMRLGTFLAFE